MIQKTPKIVKGGWWPDIVAFRKAIRYFTVKTGFEFADLVTDKTKFRARCKVRDVLGAYRKCSRRDWQVTGKPCKHALAYF